jgi:hypothetical protein
VCVCLGSEAMENSVQSGCAPRKKRKLAGRPTWWHPGPRGFAWLPCIWVLSRTPTPHCHRTTSACVTSGQHTAVQHYTTCCLLVGSWHTNFFFFSMPLTMHLALALLAGRDVFTCMICGRAYHKEKNAGLFVIRIYHSVMSLCWDRS